MKKFGKFFLFLLILALPMVTKAGVLPPCTATGNCGFCDMMYTVNAIMRWITVVAGSVSMLFFVWAGFLMVSAAGRMEKVEQAKKILRETIIGLVIVFVAWTGVNLLINVMTGVGDQAVIYTSQQQYKWYNLCVARDGQNDCVGRGDGYPCDNRNGHCERGTCVHNVSACAWLATQPGYEAYKCQAPADCDLKSYEECFVASNCIKDLCPEGAENVCCFKK